MEDDDKNNLKLSMASYVNMAGTSITVTAISPDIEEELIFPADISKEELSSSLCYALGPKIKQTEIEQIVEKVENIGIKFGGIELGMSPDGVFSFKINFGPKKTIRTFSRIKGEK